MLTQTTIGKLVLAVIIGLVFLVFFDNWDLVAEANTIDQRCRLSVERNARYNIAGIELGPQIDCPTRHLVLEKSGEDAKEGIANAMYTCWKQFNQGKARLFSGEGTFCNVCYTIDLKTKDDVIGFPEYLRNTPSPEENLYYYDYLSNFETSRAKEVLGNVEVKNLQLDRTVIETDNKYAVIFVYAKGIDQIKRVKDQWLAQNEAGKVITGVAGFSAAAAGTVTVITLVTAPVSVPVIAVVGGAAVVVGSVFVGVEVVGSFFNPSNPPEWVAFTVLREWNPDTTPYVLTEQLGCSELVERESN